MHLLFRSSPLRLLTNLLQQCNAAERKAIITLARSQHFPDPVLDPTLYSKTKPILDRLTAFPPFVSLHQTPLSEVGTEVHRLISSPLLTGLVIVIALGVSWTDDEIRKATWDSFNKELSACLTRRRESTWNWRVLLGPTPDAENHEPHREFPVISILQHRFRTQLSRYRAGVHRRTIYPHYTRRGVSTDTSTHLLHRLRDLPIIGTRKTMHRNIDRKNVTSKDVVTHFLRTGNWTRGITEMKQRWYPSGLVPRTYFCWGGMEIQASTYLRDFFNDLADCFEPTEKMNRVQPDWLHQPPNATDESFFFFYDLTSFTSWFHEQVPFLRALSDYFSGYSFDVVDAGLTLTRVDIGSMIECYIQQVNDFPEFTINEGITGKGGGDAYYKLKHLCAGFLGIPGNLITCTLPHGLAQASLCHDSHSLQVPGDDVGIAVMDDNDMYDRGYIANTLGYLQMDKVYESRQGSVYLKRGVRILDGSVNLTQMLIYPLIPYLVSAQDSSTLRNISRVYRLPKIDRIISRACSVMATFYRDLWKISQGQLTDYDIQCISDLLRAIHDTLQLPYGPIIQGRCVDNEDSKTFQDVALKFPLDEPGIFMEDPDRYFAERYIEVYHIHDMEDEFPLEVVRGSLKENQTIVVRPHRGWRLLEDVGIVARRPIAGIVKTLIGRDAKIAYMTLKRPEFSEVTIKEEIPISVLCSLGIVEGQEGMDFSEPVLEKYWEEKVYSGVVSSWSFRGYVDLDRPSAAAERDEELDYGDDFFPMVDPDSGDEGEATFSWDVLLNMLK